jgi:Rad3-related DNA helicase
VDNTKPIIDLSVGDILQYSKSEGDLEQSSAFLVNRASLGTKVHQKIQNRRPSQYHSEVPVYLKCEENNYILNISGRIDGLVQNDDGLIIEEIKSTLLSKNKLSDDLFPDHWLQAQLYAYMIHGRYPYSDITIRICYGILPEIREVVFEKIFTYFEIVDIIESKLAIIKLWIENYLCWISERDRSIKDLNFPFSDLRSGQEEMIEAVRSNLNSDNNLILQAPTGSGKTIAILFAAVKSAAVRNIEKIFYLTAKTTGKNEAVENLAILLDSGLKMRAISLTAKEKICMRPGSLCHISECEYAGGYYSKLPEAISALTKYDSVGYDIIIDIAEKLKICPFELSLDYSEYCDIIICDYNYLIDPSAQLRRYFVNRQFPSLSGKYITLIDEAHNLPQRARSNYSLELDRDSILKVQGKLKSLNLILYKQVKGITRELAVLRDNVSLNGNWDVSETIPMNLLKKIKSYISSTEKLNFDLPNMAIRKMLNDMLFAFQKFLSISEQWDDCHQVIYKVEKKNMVIQLYCMDPSKLLKQYLSLGGSSVFFSATLDPDFYYSHFLAVDETEHIQIQSEFEPDNVCVMIANYISTRYKQRAASLKSIIKIIKDAVDIKMGNYMIFFPSYKYLNQAADIFEKLCPQFKIHIQEPGMTEVGKNQFLDHFKKKSTSTQLGFVVTGGFFGEGINLPGENLIGVIVVGIAHPPITIENELIREYFDNIGEEGYGFSYTYPSLNSVLQSAGRLIRGVNDRGLILFIGDRFSNSGYMDILEKYWNPEIIDNNQDLKDRLELFWSSD